MCANGECHVIINNIKTLLKGEEEIQAEQVQELYNAVSDYMSRCKLDCPEFCAQFIATLKRLAFTKTTSSFHKASTLYRQLFTFLHLAWKSGLKADKERARDGYVPVIEVPVFLQGWTADLQHVQMQALSAYGSLLRCNDVYIGEDFGPSVRAFVKRVKRVMEMAKEVAAEEVVILAGEIAYNFIGDVLSPLLDLNLEMAIEHIEDAANLIDEAVRFDPAKALRHQGRPALSALDLLRDHIVSSQKQKGASSETCQRIRDIVYGNVYKILIGLWEDTEPSRRSYLMGIYVDLMPLLGKPDWQKSRPVTSRNNLPVLPGVSIPSDNSKLTPEHDSTESGHISPNPQNRGQTVENTGEYVSKNPTENNDGPKPPKSPVQLTHRKPAGRPAPTQEMINREKADVERWYCARDTRDLSIAEYLREQGFKHDQAAVDKFQRKIWRVSKRAKTENATADGDAPQLKIDILHPNPSKQSTDGSAT